MHHTLRQFEGPEYAWLHRIGRFGWSLWLHMWLKHLKYWNYNVHRCAHIVEFVFFDIWNWGLFDMKLKASFVQWLRFSLNVCSMFLNDTCATNCIYNTWTQVNHAFLHLIGWWFVFRIAYCVCCIDLVINRCMGGVIVVCGKRKKLYFV